MTLNKLLVRFAILCLGLVSFVAAQGPADTKRRAEEESEIKAAVLRKQMMEWVTAEEKGEKEAKTESDRAVAHHLNFRIFFVEVEQKDPDKAFLERFSDVPRILKKASGSAVSKDYRMAVIDKRTGERAILFYVGKVSWKSETSAEIEGGYHCDGLCAAGITFSLELKDAKWIVVSEKMNWIS
jgi:hypothetical protein